MFFQKHTGNDQNNISTSFDQKIGVPTWDSSGCVREPRLSTIQERSRHEARGSPGDSEGLFREP